MLKWKVAWFRHLSLYGWIRYLWCVPCLTPSYFWRDNSRDSFLGWSGGGGGGVQELYTKLHWPTTKMIQRQSQNGVHKSLFFKSGNPKLGTEPTLSAYEPNASSLAHEGICEETCSFLYTCVLLKRTGHEAHRFMGSGLEVFIWNWTRVCHVFDWQTFSAERKV